MQISRLKLNNFRNYKEEEIFFNKGINIITSDLNSVGKTSLSLMILYSFGAKVKFSDKWSLDNIFNKLTLSQNEKDIVIIPKEPVTIKNFKIK